MIPVVAQDTLSVDGKQPFPVAIVGIALRLPGAISSLDDLWAFLARGGDAIGDLPDGRWSDDTFDPTRKRPGTTYVQRGGYLDQLDLIDAKFFGLSAREASRVDPQQRLLLETAFEAMENAGLPLGDLARRRVGVFVGLSSNDYLQIQARDPRQVNAYSATGGALSIAANRLSYVFNLRGPSLTVDTACSSGLTALNLAARSLRTGDCSVALVGAANALLMSETFISFSAANMLSPEGRCRAFDASASGFVRAEGAVTVVLKPMADALRDNDPILGVVHASDVNSDGKTAGLSLPSGEAQAELLRRIYDGNGIDINDLVYIEAHGTGTTAGDPIEAEAIGHALSRRRRAAAPLPIGSIKTNIGHLEPASGLAGLAKSLAILRHDAIPPSLHFEAPNPRIDFDGLKLAVPTSLTPLDGAGERSLIGINSFGFGGSNAHAVVGRAPAREALAELPVERPWFLISARSPEALAESAAALSDHVSRNPDTSLHDLSGTLLTRRSWHRERVAVWADTLDDLRASLDTVAAGGAPGNAVRGTALATAKPVLVFTGNGPQWWAMGRELLAGDAVFRETIEELDAAFRAVGGIGLIEEMSRPEADSRMAMAEAAQPVLFALQLGMMRMLAAEGIRPGAIVGHSVGEVAAAHAAGAIDLATAIRIIDARSHFQGKTAGTGSMVVVDMEPEAGDAFIADEPDVVVSVDNGPGVGTVLSGPPDAIDRIIARVENAGILARKLPLDYGFHSPLMEPIRDGFLERIGSISAETGSDVPLYSSVTGARVDPAALDADYWWRNIRAPVRFRDAIRALLSDRYQIFLEIGPHPVLTGYVRSIAEAASVAVRTASTLRRGSPEMARMRTCLAELAVSGARFDWSARFPQPVRPLALPAYPWQRERHYNHIGNAGRGGLKGLPSGHLLLGSRLPVAEPVWSASLSLDGAPFIADHVVRNSVLFPAAGFFEMAIAAGAALDPGKVVDLHQVQIAKALPLEPGASVLTHVAVDPVSRAFTISSRPEAAGPDEEQPFTEHVRGVIGHRPAAPRTIDLDAIAARMTRHVEAGDHYRAMSDHGLQYGPAFRVVADIRLGDGELLARLTRGGSTAQGLHLDPTLVDGALQAMSGLVAEVLQAGRDGAGQAGDVLFLPVGAERLACHAPTDGNDELFAHIVLRDGNASYVSGDVVISDAVGAVLAEIRGMKLRRVGGAKRQSLSFYDHTLVPLHSFRTSQPALAAPLSIPRDALRPAGDEAGVHARYRAFLCAIVARYAVRALARIAGSDRIVPNELIASGQVAARHRAYVEAVLGVAATEGLVEGAGGEGGAWRVIDTPDPLIIWREALAALPGYLADWHLLARAGAQLPRLLSGEVQTRDLLAPQRNSAVSEQFYEQGAAFSRANAAVRDTLVAIAGKAPAGRTLRVLQIGGGAGGTTAALLPLLPADRVDYLFTDASADLVSGAENRFSGCPFFRAEVLDVAAGAEEKADWRAAFDVILAVDAMHGVADRAGAARNLLAWLAPGGCLLQVEAEHAPAFTSIFSALPASGAGPASSLYWSDLLDEAGFAPVDVLTDAATDAPPALAMFVARAPEEKDASVTEDPPGDERGGSALVFDLAADTALASLLTERLTLAGRPVTVVAPDQGDDRALAAFSAGLAADPPAEIVVIAPFSTRADKPRADEGWFLVSLLKAVNAAGWKSAPCLTVVTEELWGEGSNIAAAAYWGIGRTIANEQPDWISRRIDVAATAQARTRAAEWIATGHPALPAGGAGEADELRFTDDGIFALRLDAIRPERDAVAPDPAKRRGFAVSLSAQGSISNLGVFETAPAGDLGEHDIEVAVHAAGLNFKDIILALGLLPPELLRETVNGLAMGLEAAGTVTRVGAGVSLARPGERVMFMTDGAFASSLVIDERAVRPVPEGWTCEEAATVPIVGLTVIYALKVLAQLRAGETLLVHGGAGGIGLAAIQYAKAVGARVIATAGAQEKRDLLAALGVDLVTDSRSLAFETDVDAFTGGEGVDVVLNSLAGEAMQASLNLLKPFGRFVEIGKRDFEANSRINLRALERNISYFAVDLTFLHVHRPAVYQEVWDALLEEIAGGRFHPLPHRTYPVARVGEAFRQMQAGRHIGKLVIALDPAGAVIERRGRAAVRVATDGAHVITGGLGGLGLKIAGRLVDYGVRTLVLVGRRPVTTDEQRRAVAALEERGARVIVETADVTDEASVAALLERIRERAGPIRGIVHSVLVLDDQLMLNMRRESFTAVTAPKSVGAWALDRHTSDDPLDYFVALSSIAATVGNPGQAAYVAANAALDHMMAARRAQGRPGLALALGPVADVGVVNRSAEVGDQIARSGMKPLASSDVLDALDVLLGGERAGALLAGFADRVRLPLAASFRLRHLLSGSGEAADAASGERVDFSAFPPAERAGAVLRVLRESLAQVTGTPVARIDADQSVLNVGIDSLMAVELSLLLESRIGMSMAMSDFIQDRSLADIAVLLLERLGLSGREAGEAPPAAGAEAARGASAIDWAADCTLDDDIRPSRPPVEGPVRHIFLTGANGFLGCFLLDRLLSRTDAAITCLVRADDTKGAEHRLRKALTSYGLAPQGLDRRVRVIVGDLGKRRLGFDEQTYEELAESIDTVYHSAATLNFFQPYPRLRAANVGSTREILRFATHGLNKRFHHISTAFVFDTAPLAGRHVDETTALVSPDAINIGYSQSKWVAEQLVDEARRRGLRTAVYRPPFIVGSSDTGAARIDDFLSLTVRAWLELRSAPQGEYAIYMSPVDWVADVICAISQAEEALGDAGAGKAWHVFDRAPVPTDTIIGWMKAEVADFSVVTWSQWLGRASAAISARPDHFASRVLPFWSEIHERSLDRAGTMPLLDNAATMAVAAGFGLEPRPFDEVIFRRFLRFLSVLEKHPDFAEMF